MTADGTQITTAADLDALPVGSVVLDNGGDAGLVDEPGVIRYAETLPMAFEYVVKHYAPLTVLFRPDALTDDAVERLPRFTFEDPDADPTEEFVRLADVRAAFAATRAGEAEGWPEQIARAVAVVRAEAASYEAVSRMGAESLHDDESDMPERMVDRLIDAGLIAPPAGDGEAEHACADERLTDPGPICRQCGEALDREALADVSRYAQRTAISEHARGRYDEERSWLDILALIERAAPAAPTVTAGEGA